MIGALLLAGSLYVTPVLCPADQNDPPWRPITCYILSRLGEPDDRIRLYEGEPVEGNTES